MKLEILKKKEPTEEQFNWFLRGYKYAIMRLDNERKKDVRVSFYEEFRDDGFEEIDEMHPK